METYEKKYKEALERARQFSEKPYLEDSKGIVDYIFPELKESEDMIMVKFIKNQLFNIKKTITENYELDTKLTKAIDWLEKQGKQNLTNSAKTCKDVEQKPTDKIYLGKKYKCIASPRYTTFLTGIIYQPSDKYLCSLMNFCSDCFEPIEDCEQKSVFEIKSPEESLGIDSDTYNKIVDECVYGEQNPADKVEPKFKVGDTIYYNSFGELKSMIVANVVTDSTDNPMYEDKEGNAVFEKDLIEHKSVEVRTTGYWNVQDIEQKPAWSKEDEDILNTIINHFKIDIECTDEDDTVRWLKSIKDRVQPQLKQELSEEDERLRKEIVNYLECQKEEEPTRKEKINSWISWILKHSFSEWTKEEKEAWNKRLDCIVDILDWAEEKGRISLSDCQDYSIMLKSLRPQNWKPSEGHLKALSIAMQGVNDPLFSLYQDLQKLKDEK